MKILACGDHMKSPTGYGRVSNYIYRYFANKGHIVYHAPATMNFNPPETILPNIVLLPSINNSISDAVKYYDQLLKPDLVYNADDFFHSETYIDVDLHCVTTQYGIIDGPDAGRCYKHIIEKTDVPVTPSQYGHKQLLEYNKNSLYIPHGVDLNIYQRKDEDIRKNLKKQLGLQDKFVYGCVNRNIWRKQYINLLKAFKKVHEKHKDTALLLVCDPNDGAGSNLYNWAKFLDLKMSNNVNEDADIRLHPAYLNILLPLTEQQLCDAYNAMDVMASASLGEGFGLSTIESQACGTPVVIGDNTANTELVKGHGFLYKKLLDCNGDPVMFAPVLKDITYNYEIPDFGDMYNKMLEAYERTNLLDIYKRECYEFAIKYDWNKVLPLWDQVLNFKKETPKATETPKENS